MADKKDNGNVPPGLSSDTVIQSSSPQDKDSIPTNILQFENLVSGFSAVLIGAPTEELENELNGWLKKFVGFLKVDRCIINEYQDDKKTVKPLISHTVPDVDIHPPEESLMIPDRIMSQFERGIIIRAEKYLRIYRHSFTDG